MKAKWSSRIRLLHILCLLFTHSLTRSLTHSLTHSLTQTLSSLYGRTFRAAANERHDTLIVCAFVCSAVDGNARVKHTQHFAVQRCRLALQPETHTHTTRTVKTKAICLWLCVSKHTHTHMHTRPLKAHTPYPYPSPSLINRTEFSSMGRSLPSLASNMVSITTPSTTVILFCVSVPVLSLQTVVAPPIVSHASRWRTRLLSLKQREGTVVSAAQSQHRRSPA